MDAKKNKKIASKEVVITLLIILSFLGLIFLNPDMTGFTTFQETNIATEKITLNETFSKNTTYEFIQEEVLSLKISGDIKGNATIWINTTDGLILAYKTQDKKETTRAITSITGLTTGSTRTAQEEVAEDIQEEADDEFETLETEDKIIENEDAIVSDANEDEEDIQEDEDETITKILENNTDILENDTEEDEEEIVDEIENFDDEVEDVLDEETTEDASEEVEEDVEEEPIEEVVEEVVEDDVEEEPIEDILDDVDEDIEENITDTDENIIEIIDNIKQENITDTDDNITDENITDINDNLTDIIDNITDENITEVVDDVTQIIHLKEECADTCSLNLVNVTSIIIEIHEGEIYIEEIVLTKPKTPEVEQIKNFKNITLEINQSTTLNLSEYFSGEDLIFDSTAREGYYYSLIEDEIIFTSAKLGEWTARIYAVKGSELFRSNEFVINVVQELNLTEENLTLDNVTADNITEIDFDELKLFLEPRAVEEIRVGEAVTWRQAIIIENETQKELTVPSSILDLKIFEETNQTITDATSKARNVNEIISGNTEREIERLSRLEEKIPEQARNQILQARTNLEEKRAQLPERARASELDETIQIQETRELSETQNEEVIIFVENISNETTYLIVEYETEPPILVVDEETNNKKTVTITSETHYENIRAELDLPKPARKTAIHLAHIKEKEKEKVIDIEYIDETGDGLIDKISWIIPHLSNQTYELELIILNPIEYLVDGDEWTVLFETTGTGNLTIHSENAEWDELLINNENTTAEMQFIEWMCGNSQLHNEIKIINNNGTIYSYNDLENQSIKPTKFFIENYNCDDSVSTFKNHMNTAGYAELTFTFANENFTVQDVAIDPTEIDACQSITSSGLYHLSDNISSNGTCIFTSAHNIVLDCQGHTITYSLQGANETYGIRGSGGYNNITIKNCIIQDGNWSGNATRNGIHFSGSNGSTIYNNIINVSNGAGIYFITSTYTNVTGNTVTSNGTAGIRIATGSHYSTIENNIVTNTNDDGIYTNYVGTLKFINNTVVGAASGIYSARPTNALFLNNNITGGTEAGLRLRFEGPGYNITGNVVDRMAIVTDYGYISDNEGILSFSAENTIIKNHYAYSTTGTAINIYSSAEANVNITNCTAITTANTQAFRLNGMSGVKITDCTARSEGTTGRGILIENSNNNEFIRLNATSNNTDSFAISLINSNNNQFIDCAEIDGFTNDINFASGSTNNTFLNCNYNISKEIVSSGQLFRKWWLFANVTDSFNDPVPGALVSTYNNTGGLDASAITNSEGTVRYAMTEYKNIGGTRTYQNNIDVNVTKPGYTTNSSTHNLTVEKNLDLNFTIDILSIQLVVVKILTSPSDITFLLMMYQAMVLALLLMLMM
jgi:parallel beta-helix repeat protein